ncbi:hypothetical protein FRC06_005102 [Ceratobasidium sp. 370]|nr:hypothetical protein FRC06_005102 [Ceratobasidium sp. 370]
MSSSTSSVLIVGAGPSGLALALALLQNGVAPRALELYNLLGVTEIVAKAGPYQPLVHHKVPEIGAELPQVLSTASLRTPSPDIPFPNLVMIGQDVAEGALRSHMETHYATFVELGTSLQKFEQHDEYVKVHLLKSEDGVDRQEVLTVRWLIGADGPKSTVRKQAGFTFLGETRAQRFISGDIHIRCDLDRKVAHRWGPSIINGIGLQPSERLDDTLFQFIIGGPAVPFDTLLSDHEKIFDYISNGIGRSKLTFGELVLVDDWRPNFRMANKFFEKRIFLVGDAAHVHCTTGGQGIVSCLQDSVNLGWKLALVERGLSSPRLLSTYDEERRPVISDMLRITTDLFDGVVAGKPWPSSLFLSLLRQFGVNYRRSSIVLDDTRGTPWTDNNYVGTYGACGCIVQAGDRAPDAPGLVEMDGLRETSIFKILALSRHTIFVLAESAEATDPFFSVISGCPTSLFERVLILSASGSSPTRVSPCIRVLRDRDGHAFRHYSVKEEPRAVVVRPDGIIGALVNNPNSLERYRDIIFMKSISTPP